MKVERIIRMGIRTHSQPSNDQFMGSLVSVVLNPHSPQLVKQFLGIPSFYLSYLAFHFTSLKDKDS